MGKLKQVESSVQTFNVSIEGYWEDRYESPSYAGLYFIYEGRYNFAKNRIRFEKLLFIGFSENILSSLVTTSRYQRWKSFVKEGNKIFIATAQVEKTIMERVAAAFIYRHKPTFNSDYKFDFPFPATRVISVGNTRLLNTGFTVCPASK